MEERLRKKDREELTQRLRLACRKETLAQPNAKDHSVSQLPFPVVFLEEVGNQVENAIAQVGIILTERKESN